MSSFCRNSSQKQTFRASPHLRTQYADTSEGIRDAYADVPCKVVDCSQSDLETFAEVCDFVEEVGAKKAERLGAEGMRALLEMVSVPGGTPFCASVLS